MSGEINEISELLEIIEEIDKIEKDDLTSQLDKESAPYTVGKRPKDKKWYDDGLQHKLA